MENNQRADWAAVDESKDTIATLLSDLALQVAPDGQQQAVLQRAGRLRDSIPVMSIWPNFFASLQAQRLL